MGAACNLLITCVRRAPNWYNQMESIPEYCHQTLTVLKFLEVLYALVNLHPFQPFPTGVKYPTFATGASFQKTDSSSSTDRHSRQLQ